VHAHTADTLPVNYAVLTGLPVHAGQKQEETKTSEGPKVSFCDTHKNREIEFFCKSCNEMFCSKCVLKHTQQKHDVTPCSHQSKFELTSVIEMRGIIKNMLDDVEVIDQSNSFSEDLYTKLEQKVKKKFQEEVDRLEKSFRRIIEQLEVQQQNLYTMMKEQIDKELSRL